MKKLLTLTMIFCLVWGTVSFAQSPAKTLPGDFEKSLKDAFNINGIGNHPDVLINVICNFINDQDIAGDQKNNKAISYMNEMIHKEWDSNNWNLVDRSLYIFDPTDINTDQYIYEWDSTKWVNMMHIEITYNAQNLPEKYLIKMWDESTNTWEDNAQMLFTYNPNNSPSEVVMQMFLMTWIDFMKIEFYYNPQDQLIETFTKTVNLSTMQLENSSRSTFQYDANGFEIEELILAWDGNTWVNDERYTSTNNSSGYRTEKLTEYWIGGVWENGAKITYTYDAQWKTIQEKEEIWNGTGWENSTLISFTYDIQERIYEELTQVWDGTAWENYEIDVWAYALPIGVNDKTVSPVSVKIFPNPAISSTTISIELNDATDIKIWITDATGRAVSEIKEPNLAAGIHNITIPTANLSPGYYFLSLVNSSGIMAREKLMISR